MKHKHSTVTQLKPIIYDVSILPRVRKGEAIVKLLASK